MVHLLRADTASAELKVVVGQTFVGVFTRHVGDCLPEVVAAVEVLELAVVGYHRAWLTAV